MAACTVTLLLGPAAAELLLATSLATPASMEIVNVPLPVNPLMRSVGFADVPLSTLTVPATVPVGVNVTLPLVRLIELAPVIDTGKSTGPLVVTVAEGEPIATVGATVS